MPVDAPDALTFYAARVSEERTWQHVLRDPAGAEYADAYLVAGAWSHAWAEKRDGALRLIFWLLELTAGPPDGPWSVVLRLHHRSTGWGVMGVDDGGMNAPGLGFRYEF